MFNLVSLEKPNDAEKVEPGLGMKLGVCLAFKCTKAGTVPTKMFREINIKMS